MLDVQASIVHIIIQLLVGENRSKTNYALFWSLRYLVLQIFYDRWSLSENGRQLSFAALQNGAKISKGINKKQRVISEKVLLPYLWRRGPTAGITILVI